MRARERWQVGLAMLTAYIGPAERRAADISFVAGEHDPREVVFGTLAVAKDLMRLVCEATGAAPSDVLQTLAEREAAENE